MLERQVNGTRRWPLGSVALALLAAAVAAPCTPCMAGGIGQTGPIGITGPGFYTGIGDSPFFDLGCDRPGVEFFLETFEDGLLNTPGLIVNPQEYLVLAPGPFTDSVDPNGRSMQASPASAGMVTLGFDPVVLGDYPRNVGFVLTDTNGVELAPFVFVIIDGAGNFATYVFPGLGDASAEASTDDDFFFGITSESGIAQVQILSPFQGWEIDHIQYSNEKPPASPTRGDLDGSASGDIVFHVPGGPVTAWFLQDTVESPVTISGVLSSAWTLQGFGDIDADCDDDLVWRNNTNPSKVQVWTMQDGAVVDKTNITTTLGSSWTIVGVADFDGDAKVDLLMKQDSTEKMRIWFLDGNAVQSGAWITPPPGFAASAHTVTAVGDIDRDGFADIVWRRTSNGDVSYFRMGGATVLQYGLIQAGLSQSWSGLGGGDFNGDGVLDLGYRKPATGTVLLRLMNPDFTILGSAQIEQATSWSHVGFPDVNGDGKADVVWRKASNGKITRWKMNGLSLISNASIGTGPTGSAKAYAER